MHQIGVGVLGPVYRTHDPDADRLVALKAFQLDLTPEQSSALVTALTGIVGAGLSHPAIVTPVGAGLADGVPYLALEYVAAESLDVAIRPFAPVSLDTVLPFVVQLAEALDAAHAQGFVHGALHLRDIFVTPDLPRITGFGVVAALELVGLRGPLRRPYTAPEQIAGGTCGPAADRFALAAIAYELLTGKRAAGTGAQVADRLAGVPGNDTTRLARFFATALAHKSDARPTSARLFADQLADAVGWTGADAVRTVLDGMGRQADAADDMDAQDDVERHQEDHAPVTVVSGGSARVFAGVEVTGTEVTGTEVTGTEEAAHTMANIRGRKSKTEPPFDWTERTLDRGESDELVPAEAYQPRPPGSVAPGEPRGRADRDGVPDFDGIDRALTPTPDELTMFADAADAEDGAGRPDLDLTLVSQDAEDESGQSDIDATEVEWRAPRAPARHEASEVEAELPRTVEGDDDVPDDRDVELEVVQARYRRVGAVAASDDPAGSQAPDVHPAITLSDLAAGEAASADDAPDSQAPGLYPAITLSDLPGPRGAAGERSADDSNGGADLGAPASAAAYDDPFNEEDDEGDDLIEVRGQDLSDDDRYAPTLPFAPDAAYGEHGDYDDEDHLEAGLAAAGWAPRGRRLPVALLGLVAVVVTAVAFAVGFGWVDGSGDPNEPVDTAQTSTASEPAMAEAAVAGGLVVSPPPPTREFSEASVAPPERVREAPVTSPAAVPPAPRQPLARDEPAPGQGEGAPVTAETRVPRPPTTPAVAESRAEPPPATGRLLLRSTPPGVEVMLDGEARGTTPLVVPELRFGTYDVQLHLEGYESQDLKFSIASDDPIAAINADLARLTEAQTASLGVGSVFVDTRPRGVEVWLDRRLVGETPMLIPNIPAGVHDVEFRYDGYRDWATTVQVGPSAQARVTASLDHVRR